jgi:hypothetical protein
MRRHSIASFPQINKALLTDSFQDEDSQGGRDLVGQQPLASASRSSGMVVAVRIRPLSHKEQESGQTDCSFLIYNRYLDSFCFMQQSLVQTASQTSRR